MTNNTPYGVVIVRVIIDVVVSIQDGRKDMVASLLKIESDMLKLNFNFVLFGCKSRNFILLSKKNVHF